MSETTRSFSGTPIAIILGLLLIGAGVFKWWPSDERAIRRQLDALADTVTVPPNETDMARLSRVAQLRGYFAPDARIQLASAQTTDRDTLVGLAAQWAPPPAGVFVQFADVSVTRGDDGTAQISLTAKVTTRDPGSGQPALDAREAAIGMAKIEGDWVITSVEWQEILKRPGSP